MTAAVVGATLTAPAALTVVTEVATELVASRSDAPIPLAATITAIAITAAAGPVSLWLL